MLAIELIKPTTNTNISLSFFDSCICIIHMMISGTGIKSQSVMICKDLVARLILSLSRHLMVRASATWAMALKEYSAATGWHWKALKHTQIESRQMRRAR